MAARKPKLVPDPHNARSHPQRNRDLIRRSLEEVGPGRSILVDGQGIIRAGNGVYEQAQALGLPVRVVDAEPGELIAVRRKDLKGARAERAALLDNRAAETAAWDVAALAALREKSPELLDGLFESAELDALLAGLNGGAAALPEPGAGGDEFYAAPAEAGAARTKLGELWLLTGDGLEHRLLVGDCTDPANVARLMGGAKADLLHTDPPYGINAIRGTGGQWGGAADRYAPMVGDSSPDVAKRAFCLVAEMGIPVQIWWGANHYCGVLPDSPCWVVWYKRSGPDANDFADCELAYTNQPGRARLVHHVWNGAVRDSERGVVRDHPAQKPVFLVGWCLKEYGSPADVILDLFLGSGTTVIAGHRLGRRVYGCEIEPRYGDVILKRAEAEGLTCARADF